LPVSEGAAPSVAGRNGVCLEKSYVPFFFRRSGTMTIFQAFNELDEIIMLQYGDVDAALQTDRGKYLVDELLSEGNRAELREWYKPRPRPLNRTAMEIKQLLERVLGEAL
jgi:hypothetical protein